VVTKRKQTQTVHHYKKTNTNGTPLQENKHKRYTTTRKQTQTVRYYKKTNTNGTPLQENKVYRLCLFSCSGVPFVFVFL
jgi:CRISPR/Cas system type I-B associated protein Csh2 (Cas7 group RAMP superfamily)